MCVWGVGKCKNDKLFYLVEEKKWEDRKWCSYKFIFMPVLY